MHPTLAVATASITAALDRREDGIDIIMTRRTSAFYYRITLWPRMGMIIIADAAVRE